MKFVSFASSSKGNCAFISYKNTNILVDCGISRKRIETNLSKYGKTLKDIDAIFITHAHDDHISGLPMVLKNDDIKIISQKPTLMKIANLCEEKGVDLNLENMKIIMPVNFENEDSGIKVKDIKVIPLKGTHDVPSLYYKFVLGDTVIAILTDMGLYTDYTVRSLKDVNFLMLECNYDSDMLMESEKYNAYLKSRIMGSGGHLSNVNCSEIIMQLASKNFKEVYLSHISDETNTEEYAYDFVVNYLKNSYNKKEKLPDIHIAKRLELTEIIND